MGKVFEVGDEYIREDDVKDEINDILNTLRNKKRTYSMNIFLLKRTIDFLENKVQEEVNSKIFQ